MAPAIAKANGRRTSSAGLESQKASPSPATTDSSQVEGTRPAKKVRTIKLNGPKKNTAPVGPVEEEPNSATRPQRTRRPPAIFDQDDRVEVELSPVLKPAKRAPSPALSSGSSSLSSAPLSPSGDSDGSREESPFQDPVQTSITDAYGVDFTMYYTTGLDIAEQAEKPDKKRKRTSSSGKHTSKVDPSSKSEGAKQQKTTKSAASRRSSSSAKATATPSAPAQQPVMPEAQNLPPQNTRAPAPHHQQQPPHTNKPPPVQQRQQHQQSPLHHHHHHHHHGPAPYPQSHPPAPPQGPHMQQGSAGQPVIRFIEVPVAPVPVVPDTIAIMISKLQSLSDTLTQFGGVPAVAVTPPPEPKPAPEHIDLFLNAFDDSEDGSDKSEAPQTPAAAVVPEVRDFDRVLPNPGTADSPLCFGIAFIQNALKSWAQQRMTHQIMAQWNDEQSRGFFLPQNSRARGRPKKFEASPGGPPPVIEMNLTDTPEGIAIQKFQSILDSECLQVNTVLPIELGRALRLLYMQIDNLINQGRTEDKGDWYCMSYGAQITAHHARLNQFKEAEARRQQEVALSQQQHQQQVMAQMGLNPHTTPMTQEEAQRHHAMELERRRSAQHAQQQPYISQQHLHPLQLAFQASPAPNQHGPSPTSSQPQQGFSTVNGSQGPPGTPDGSAPVHANGVPQRNHFDKVKMYMPGFLPLSGQSMKFSFAPNSEEAIRAFGPEAFPTQGPVGPQLPNRGPMMDVPRMYSNTPSHHPAAGDTPMPDAVRSPSVSNTKEDAIDLTASDGPQPEQSGVAASRPATSNGSIGGFRPINVPTQGTPKSTSTRRRSSVAAPQTSDSISRRPSAIGVPVIKRQNRGSAGSFPHPGAVVVDE
ncbi:hypothetical protein Slin15195_G017990 [Septoria linicola]|uniref:Uncharacterized protein n=1 Tax=Septoria linicola TaxID=215465 RepID=A0A9Q9EF20_9PEZI|nr:hypothetical protein Slin14017_G018050 [Septoria linicola]USW48480.1 hypothetical protein Slin15195_G017990 [Septoria linicola]